MKEEKVTKIIERFWHDVESLPWQDPAWVQNKAHREATRQHFVTSTTFDILKAIGEDDAEEEVEDATS